MKANQQLSEGSSVEYPQKVASEESAWMDGLDLVSRFRYWLYILIFGSSFAISWAAGQSATQRVWLTVPETVSNHLGIDLGAAIIGVTSLAILLAVTAAILRTWGAVYLGKRVAFNPRVKRNTVYLGTLLHTLALCMLMSWAGAVFAIVAVCVLQAALIVADQHRAERGPGYPADSETVPRQGISPASSAQGPQPKWGQAFTGEIYMWGVAASFAAFGFTYNALLIEQGMLVSFGLSVVVRGLTTRR